MKRPIWFVRKTYGYGWTPATWQGWVIIAVWVCLIIWNYIWIKQSTLASGEDFLRSYIPSTVILVVALLVVTWLTGERPRWQWGKKDEEKK